jgi:hypothetical protein
MGKPQGRKTGTCDDGDTLAVTALLYSLFLVFASCFFADFQGRGGKGQLSIVRPCLTVDRKDN